MFEEILNRLLHETTSPKEKVGTAAMSKMVSSIHKDAAAERNKILEELEEINKKQEELAIRGARVKEKFAHIFDLIAIDHGYQDRHAAHAAGISFKVGDDGSVSVFKERKS